MTQQDHELFPEPGRRLPWVLAAAVVVLFTAAGVVWVTGAPGSPTSWPAPAVLPSVGPAPRPSCVENVNAFLFTIGALNDSAPGSAAEQDGLVAVGRAALHSPAVLLALPSPPVGGRQAFLVAAQRWLCPVESH